jgi:hypothetical protein
MREIATYYSTFFILSTYISIVAVPLCLLLQKKNIINTKNSLGMIYSIIFSALLISVINPQSRFLIAASEFVFTDTLKEGFLSFRETVWNILVSLFSAEPQVYTVLMSILGIACGVGGVLYALSILVIAIKINKLEKYKKIGKLTILVDQENVTPHVFSLLNKSYVVVPKHVLEKKDFFKTAVSHELQHIRNGDTHSIYLWQFFKCLLWINPFIHIVLSYIKNLQELRVDENLIHDKKINYKVYLKTLSWFVSEGRRQPRYSLSHSIFGWSTFKELKMRIANIHRVRPMRSQPLFCLFFLAGNIFALLVIGNTSPKFQYSLYEIQRMYMPEYMKAEFVVTSKNTIEGSIKLEKTMEFAKTQSLVSTWSSHKFDSIAMEESQFKEALAKNVLNQPMVTVVSDSKTIRLVNTNLDAKVVEYTDDGAVIQLDGFSGGDIQHLIHQEKLTEEDFKKILSSAKNKEKIIKEKLYVKYNEEFKLDRIPTTFKIIKKMVPKKPVSFFPNLQDLVAEEKSNYEIQL